MTCFLTRRGYQISRHNCVEAFLADGCRNVAEDAIVISDMRMPGRSGLSLLRELRGHRDAKVRSLPVIMITGHASVPLAVDAMRLGAVHFLEKPVEPDLLLDAVAAAFEGLRRDGAAPPSGGAEARLQTLTPREREVLAAFVARGSNKAVASLLRMSPRTVEVHRTRIFRKSGATCVPELVRIAIEAGVVEKWEGASS
jgi:two-component system response regulator FixJ